MLGIIGAHLDDGQDDKAEGLLFVKAIEEP